MHHDHVNLGTSEPNVKGRARVQLFNAATGAPSLDVARDNFVSERWLRSLAWFANWGAFSNNTNNDSVRTTMWQALAFGEIPFSGLALTDYDGMPDQAERLMRGRPLAHASKGVTGGGSTHGSYNSEESVHQFVYHKFVYDFATNEANGTFQSIYTGMFNSNGITSAYTRVGSHAELNNSYYQADAWFVRDPATGTLYECWGDAIYEVIDWTPMAHGNEPGRELRTDLAGDLAQPRAFTIRDGRMYWLTTVASSARRIVSAPLGNLGNTRTERTLDNAWSLSHGGAGNNGVNFVTGFAYHPATDKMLVSVRSSNANAPKFTIMAFDAATFADGDKWGAVGNAMYAQLTTYADETGILASHEAVSGSQKSVAVHLEDDGSITTSAALLQRYPMQLAGDVGFSSISAMSSFAYNAYRLHVSPAQHFFSRTLLDQPVEKTSQNTMKITYEFTFDEPVLP